MTPLCSKGWTGHILTHHLQRQQNTFRTPSLGSCPLHLLLVCSEHLSLLPLQDPASFYLPLSSFPYGFHCAIQCCSATLTRLVMSPDALLESAVMMSVSLDILGLWMPCLLQVLTCSLRFDAVALSPLIYFAQVFCHSDERLTDAVVRSCWTTNKSWIGWAQRDYAGRKSWTQASENKLETTGHLCIYWSSHLTFERLSDKWQLSPVSWKFFFPTLTQNDA